MDLAVWSKYSLVGREKTVCPSAGEDLQPQSRSAVAGPSPHSPAFCAVLIQDTFFHLFVWLCSLLLKKEMQQILKLRCFFSPPYFCEVSRWLANYHWFHKPAYLYKNNSELLVWNSHEAKHYCTLCSRTSCVTSCFWRFLLRVEKKMHWLQFKDVSFLCKVWWIYSVTKEKRKKSTSLRGRDRCARMSLVNVWLLHRTCDEFPVLPDDPC